MIGRSINNYEIRAQIGQGGMGTVYVAEHPFIGRKVAIKILRRALVANEGIVALFMNEARAANAIRHPNIVDIIDVGRLDDGQPYLMMELLEGETLAERLLRVGRLPPSDALDFVAQTASALVVAHDRGIVHRDLKPENLLLIPDLGLPRGERVKVLDFGIAKLRGGGRADGPSEKIFVLGSPLYMSPEQCAQDEVEVDHRADIYALGGLLYHALCGVPPFLNEDVGGLLVMHLHDEPRPPRSIEPSIPIHVEAAILRALAKNPDDRFASMGAFVGALGAGTPRRWPSIDRSAAGGLDTMRVPAGHHRGGRRASRIAWAAGLCVALALAWATLSGGPVPDRIASALRARSAALAARMGGIIPLSVWTRPAPARTVSEATAAVVRPVIVPLPEEAATDTKPPGAPGTKVRPVVVMGKTRTADGRRISREVLDEEDTWGRRH